ncbi:hypothetical protein D3C72_2580790 [compost metagenome]
MLHDWMLNPIEADVGQSIRENCLSLDHRLIALLRQVESGEKTLSEVVLLER